MTRIELEYQPPYDWESIHTFLVGRVNSGSEAVIDGSYARTVRLGAFQGWIKVFPHLDRPALLLDFSDSLEPVRTELIQRISEMFDLEADTETIEIQLGSLAAAQPGLRVPGAIDGFDMAVRAILGQQITVKAATTISGRFVKAFGERIDTPFPELTHLSPTAAAVAEISEQAVIDLGIVSARARSILGLARAMAYEGLELHPGVQLEHTLQRLRALPGIGEWTAQYIAMRTLHHPDAFPHTDLGIYKALGETKGKQVLLLTERYRPYRAYAAMHLWKSL